MANLPRRPFRFSSPVGHVADRRALVERARLLEDLGYSTATMSDHFEDHLAPIATLMAVADATTELRIAPLVMSNEFRHPAVVAREAATLDVLSGGRLELGLGAGWMHADFEQVGIPLDPIDVRLERLEEAAEVITRFFGDEPVYFVGKHYRIDGLVGRPTPVQRPRPPLVIGGGGRKVLQLAARRADIVSLNPRMGKGLVDVEIGASATAAATDEKLAWIREALPPGAEPEIHVRMEAAVVTDDPEPLLAGFAPTFGLTPEEAATSPHALCGPTSAMVDALVERRERWGISYIGVPYEAADAMAPVVAALAGT